MDNLEIKKSAASLLSCATIYLMGGGILIRDRKSWLSAWSRLEAFRENLPTYITEERVVQYHAILSDLQTASGEFLNEFMIPADKVKPKPVGARRRGYSGSPGATYYSKDKYCDLDYFTGQLEALFRYLQGIAAEHIPATNKAMAAQQASSASIHVQNMYGSNIQQGSPGAVANAGYHAHYQMNDSELLKLLAEVKSLLATAQISPINKQEIESDISTVEAQLNRPQPKASIINESLHSIRAILEGAIGSMLAPHIVHQISRYLG